MPELADDDIILSLRDVGRVFTMGEVKVDVLRKIDLDILRGEFLAIVGPSGSGKTTMLNIVGGLDSPTSGQIHYNGRDITKASSAQLTKFRREEIGFVFQFYNLVPNLTARENILVASEISKSPLDVDYVLKKVGLEERSGHFPSQLSGGEQQRVAIARAIAKNPSVLLCDEPTGALDFETGKKVLRLLVDLSAEFGTTIIVITHNASLAQVCRRVVHLRSGEISQVDINEQPIAPEEVLW